MHACKQPDNNQFSRTRSLEPVTFEFAMRIEQRKRLGKQAKTVCKSNVNVVQLQCRNLALAVARDHEYQDHSELHLPSSGGIRVNFFHYPLASVEEVVRDVESIVHSLSMIIRRGPCLPCGRSLTRFGSLSMNSHDQGKTYKQQHSHVSISITTRDDN
jgi:hypothetical protein